MASGAGIGVCARFALLVRDRGAALRVGLFFWGIADQLNRPRALLRFTDVMIREADTWARAGEQEALTGAARSFRERPMDAWYPGRIVSTQREAAGLQSVHVDVSGTPLVGSHSLPGQYVRVRVNGGEGVFAIASGPETDGATFELLVKSGSDVADVLAVAPIGTPVELTAPEGPGFPLFEAYGHRVLLFATGSAISAIRSLIHAIRHERRRFRSVTLYFGARTPDAFAYESELDEWRQAGIDVVRTVSQSGAPGWEGLTGYVHAHLPQEQLTDAVAFVCGQSEMLDDVKRALCERGMPPENVFQNV
jgi:sulfhydrogenase subunit gamma (sulfur reductase)